MALPDFKKIQQDKTAVPEWAKYMDEGEFISYAVSYKTREYLSLFDKFVHPCEKTGDITYYVYDPIKHGASPDGIYPVTMWLHGASNSLMGDGCIMCCGAEQYASPDYQRSMGGAYIIVPLANEKRLDDGTILGCWDEIHSEPVKEIFDAVIARHEKNVGKKFVMGASSGGYFTWKLLENYNGFFDGAIPIASGYIPSDEALDRINESGAEIIIAHGRHDELAPFDECVAPRLDKLSSLPCFTLFLPEWVYNGDGGISSVFYGFEMGQHCMINWIQHNLIFDDKTPADERFPDGVTGWIRNISQQG